MSTASVFAPRPLALGAALLCLSLSSQAQTASTAPSQTAATADPAAALAAAPSAAGSTEHLGRVQLTGNPLRSQQLTQANSALSGDVLSLRRASSLGETLDGLPGVSASYFGPNSNRPTIRGLDGDRVRMLNNSGASVDASSLSFDHAVPTDPLVIDRVEVLRGAAALLYGGNAIGGVVNTLDNRIPKAMQPGLSGAAEVRFGGPAQERNGAVVLDGGVGSGSQGWAWHADLAGRRASNQSAPRFTAEGESATEVRNSAARSHGGAVGGSYIFAQGYAGLSLEDYHNDYGVTVEPDVQIQMQRQRAATAGEWRFAPGSGAAELLRRVSWNASSSRYQHQEVEGSGEVGTVFKNRGKDLRLELEHAPLGASAAVKGMLGVQMERSDFSAIGAEALVPSSQTRSSAVFLLEQYSAGPLTLEAGARAESVRVNSAGDAADAEEPRFGAASSQRFKPRSLSLSGSYRLSEAFSLNAQVNSSQRAPMFYELHAQGVHVASGAYERGDVNLGLERAKGVDFGLEWKQAENFVRLNLYRTRFASYIALDATGEEFEDEGERFPVYAFKSVPAVLTGFELEGHWHLPAQLLPGTQFAVSATLDGVRGHNRQTGEPLPRLAPLRASLALDANQGPWTARVEWRLSARQTRVPALDHATAGYGVLKLSLSRQLRIGNNEALWYLKLDNVGNQLAYSASSVATIRELSPLPGRSLHTGLQLRF